MPAHDDDVPPASAPGYRLDLTPQERAALLTVLVDYIGRPDAIEVSIDAATGHELPISDLLTRVLAGEPLRDTALTLYAWIGLDEYGSGVVGLKQGRVPAGLIPLVAVDRAKIDRPDIRAQLEIQARAFGVEIRLAEFTLSADGLVRLGKTSGGPGGI